MDPRAVGVRFALKLNMYGHPVETRFSDFMKVARAAEDLGFDAAFTIDHLFLPSDQVAGFSDYADLDRPFFPDAWTAMAALAAGTDRLRVGPQVTPMMRYHPALLAKFGADVDWISGGRFVLQVGTGWNPEEYTRYGLPYFESFKQRYAQLVEGVDVINALWTQEVVDYEGDFYKLEGATLWPKPVSKPRPPIWVGGSGPSTRRLVARIGDAWTPAAPHYTGLDADFYAESLEGIRTMAAQDYARDPQEILGAALFFVVIDKTSAAATEAASTLRRRDAWKDMTVEEMGRKGVALIGDGKTVTRFLEPFVDAGARYFTLGFVPIRDANETIRRMKIFAEEVLPNFVP